jgi:predicted ferric reductase
VIALASLAYVHVVTPLRQLRHRYRVGAVRSVARKTWELSIEPERGPALEFDAGQFVWLTVGRSPFAITEHPFSLASCPSDRPRVTFLVKEAGDFTNTVGRIRPGTSAYLDGPHGNFTLVGRAGAGLIFIAGGVGLAAILSILRQLQAESDPRPMKLIYGNRTEDQIAYAAELEEFRRALDLDLVHVLSEPPPNWPGEVGMFDEELLRRRLSFDGQDRWLHFVCGPPPMIEAVEGALAGLGVPLRQIVSEKFKYE